MSNIEGALGILDFMKTKIFNIEVSILLTEKIISLQKKMPRSI